MRRSQLAAAGIVCVVAAIAAPSGAQTPPPPAKVPILPDFVQEVPRGLRVVPKPAPAKGWFLTFRSAVGNNGLGNVMLVGHRASTAQRDMVVDQVVDVRDTATNRIIEQAVRPNVGRMKYIVQKDHQHWHLQAFERFELRRPDGRLAARDRKQGFCVGARYATPYGAAARRTALGAEEGGGRITYKDFETYCGLSRPAALQVISGLTPGYGDDYKANVEGQFIDITKLRPGRYVLVHRSNVASPGSVRLLEANYDNDVASVLVAIKRRAGRKPSVSLLKRCPGTSRCKISKRRNR